jgi:hypothetical protein
VAADRIRAGLIAFCAADGHADATAEALQVARELVRWGDGDPAVGSLAVGAPVTSAVAIGWATAPAAADRRRALIEAMNGSAGDDGRGPAAARAVAAMSSYAVARAPVLSVMAAGIEEAGAYGTGDLTSAAVGSWSAPDGGVPAAPLPTVAAVMAALRAGGDSPGQAIRAAAALGGRTLAVCALAGAIVAARTGGLDGVDDTGDDADLTSLAEELSALRG